MSRRCDLCHRKALNTARRSHSNIKIKVRQHLNLQKVTIEGQQVKSCTKCLKTMAKTK
ncbi:50S ribosomal protein L28 [Patescibacteria group bacterium]|nr:50S ribosomal protein L28 [Patescibacteria group bacterium]